MASISLQNVKKVYPNTEKKKKAKKGQPEKKTNLLVTEEGVVAVQEFNLEIADKEFIVLVGPSGCGKSTTLRMVAGLEDISGGDLYIDGKRVNDVAPKDRDIAMVFQSYALYPHMTVYDNLAFPLKLAKMDKAEIDKKVREAAEILDITQYLERKPKALSGGQRQRVAIGRAIVRKPKVLLMDEPLGAVDFQMRQMLQQQLEAILQQKQTTALMVTHDVDESIYLSDRVIVMSRDHGKIIADVHIDLPRPRDRTAPKYHEYVDQLTTILKGALSGGVFTQEDKDLMEFIQGVDASKSAS